MSVAARNPVLSTEDEVMHLKGRLSLAEGDRKAYYETAQYQIKLNREEANSLKHENKKLKEELAEIRRKERMGNNADMRSEVEKMTRHVRELRKHYDETKAASLKKGEEVTAKKDRLRDLQREAAQPNDETPVAQRIRALENRLDKAMIKYNEAMSIRKTYEQIVKRLEDDRLTFDTQLAQIEKALKEKDGEYEDLLSMSRDAVRAKEVAKTELEEFEHELSNERRRRERDLAERRQSVAAKAEMNERLEKKIRVRMDYQDSQMDLSQDGTGHRATSQSGLVPENKAAQEQEDKITSYEQAFRKIKDATGVSDVNEVIQKFLTQEGTHNSLLSMKAEAQARIDTLNAEKMQQRGKLEELKYAGTGSLANRRIIEEFETRYAEQHAICLKSRAKYEKVSKVLVNVKSGVEHLSEKLKNVKLDFPPITLTDETVVDVLFQCEQKLVKLLEALAVDEHVTDGKPQESRFSEADLPEYNVRVRMVGEGESEGEDELFSDNDDFSTWRERVKLQSSRSTHDQRKLRKKGSRSARNVTAGQSTRAPGPADGSMSCGYKAAAKE